uniref:Uncharacterized protein n=1 Tax=viral metagenome TaxID=1070528 RepID=A0A6M3KU72_9ZZZZ
MGEGIKNPANVGPIEDILDWMLLFTGLIYDEVDGLDGDAMRGTDNAALASVWTAALATALANYTAARAAYLDELDFDLQAALVTIAGYVDDLETRLTALRAGYLDELDFDLAAAIAAIPTTAERGTDNATLQATWTDAMAVALANYTAVRAGYLDQLDFALQEAIAAIPTTAMRGTDNAATEAKQDIIDTNVDQIEALVATTVAGKPQIVVDSTDWNSLSVGTYALVTAVGQDVIIESVTLYTTRDLSGDAGFTGVSFQTDATTPVVLISQAEGVKANLTAEGQVYKGGLAVLLKPGTYIEFTVYGGAIAGVQSLVDMVVTYKAVVSGGYIA